MTGRCLALLMALCLPVGGWALSLSLSGNAVLTREVIREADSYLLPIGPYENGRIRTLEAEGRVVQRAWRIKAQAMTTLQILTPLREQLSVEGYELLFDCAGQECGGFDFRFKTEILPAPDMFVDLVDYRFLSARKAGVGLVSVLVSRSGSTGYVQIIQVGEEGPDEPVSLVARPATDQSKWQARSGLAEQLVQRGHAVLADLEFESGSAALGAGPYASLEALAAFLREDPARQVALVGHTDAVGGLETNIGLSKKRAASVLERLVASYGVPRGQLEAEGMGYLAPVASNLTNEGRETNRRVEAVLLNHN